MMEEDLPKVSVIMPAYHVEDFIKDAIISVLRQSLKNFELLVVLDGTQEKAQKIVESFSDKRIRLLIKSHGGLSDTRNFGLQHSKGKYVYFMDPDDWVDEKLLEENIQILEREGLNFVVFGYEQEGRNKEGRRLWVTKMIPKVKAYIRGNKNLQIDGHHLEMLGYAWNKIYRRSFLMHHHIQFLKGISLVEDILFNISVFSLSDIIRFNPKCYYRYINRERKSLIRRFRRNSFDLIKRKTEALEQFAFQWNLPCKNELLSNSIVQGINYCVYNLYICDNPLNEKQKKRFIRRILNDEKTRELIRYYPASGIKERIYKKSIQYKIPEAVVRLALKH